MCGLSSSLLTFQRCDMKLILSKAQAASHKKIVTFEQVCTRAFYVVILKMSIVMQFNR